MQAVSNKILAKPKKKKLDNRRFNASNLCDFHIFANWTKNLMGEMYEHIHMCMSIWNRNRKDHLVPLNPEILSKNDWIDDLMK